MLTNTIHFLWQRNQSIKTSLKKKKNKSEMCTALEIDIDEKNLMQPLNDIQQVMEMKKKA